MTRHATRLAAVALSAVLAAPSVGLAYFPPPPPPPPVIPTPPDPFETPDTGGLGEPEPPDPGPGPNVQIPEPASIVTALTGLAMAAGYGLRQRRKLRNVE